MTLGVAELRHAIPKNSPSNQSPFSYIDQLAPPLVAPANDSRMPASLFELFAYQRNWLADPSRFKIAMVARQCGKTKFMAALEVVEDVLRHEAQGRKARWLILSGGERRALEAMEEGIKPWCTSYGAAVAVSSAPAKSCLTAGVVLQALT